MLQINLLGCCGLYTIVPTVTGHCYNDEIYSEMTGDEIMKKTIWIILIILMISVNLSSEVYGLWRGSLTIEGRITVVEPALLNISEDEPIENQQKLPLQETALMEEKQTSEELAKDSSDSPMESESAKLSETEESKILNEESP